MIGPSEDAVFAASSPFAAIQPNGTIPTTTLTLPALPSPWVLDGTIIWTGSIKYSDHGRTDPPSPPFTGSSTTWGSLQINFGGVAQVGAVTINIQAPIRNGDVTETWSRPFNGVISGINPAQSDILARLSSIPLQVICFCESTLRQFDATYGSSGMPLYHQDTSGGGGFGLMQLTNTPVPTIQQISDWHQNIDGGIQKYAGCQTLANNHFNNLKAQHPKLPSWTPAMLQLILYQLYHSGGALSAWYYLPNSTGDGWIKNTPAYTAYADTAAAYETAVRNGTPPWSTLALVENGNADKA